jgi:hypothetical protein
VIHAGLTHIATGRAVIVALLLWLGAAVVLFQFGPYPELDSLAPGLDPLDERFGYAWTDVEIYFAVLGESGRRLYRVFLIADFGNAILMASAVSLLLVFLTAQMGLTGTWFGTVAFIPIAAGTLDLLENALLLAMLHRFPDIAESLAGAGSITTTLKLAAGMTGMAAVAVGLISWAIRAVRQRS